MEGFPDAVKALRIDGRKARRLADLALHKADLDFALDALRYQPFGRRVDWDAWRPRYCSGVGQRGLFSK